MLSFRFATAYLLFFRRAMIYLFKSPNILSRKAIEKSHNKFFKWQQVDLLFMPFEKYASGEQRMIVFGSQNVIDVINN